MAQQANNQIAPRNQGGGRVIDPAGMKPTQFFTSLAVRRLLEDTFSGNKQKAAIVTSTMLSIVGSSRELQNCDPMEIFANVLRYEVLMGLSWPRDYAVISYGGRPQFQMQYQGVCTMALATNAYADADCFEVREGEFKGYDPRKRQPIFEWIADEEERQKCRVAGYYAWAELKDGRFKSKYMTRNEILRHADRYSKAFKNGGGLDAYRKMEASGNWPVGKSPWFGPADDLAHVKMCKKTVIMQLFKDPMLPRSNGVMINAIEADEIQDRTGETTTYADEFDRLAREAALSAAKEAAVPQIEAPATSITLQTENAAQGAVEAERPMPEPVPAQTAATEQTQKKRGRPAKSNAESGNAGERIATAPMEPRNDNDGNRVPMMDIPDMRGDPFPEDGDGDDPLNGNW